MEGHTSASPRATLERISKPFPIFKSKRELTSPLGPSFGSTNQKLSGIKPIEHHNLAAQDFSDAQGYDQRNHPPKYSHHEDEINDLRNVTQANAVLMQEILNLLRVEALNKAQPNNNSNHASDETRRPTTGSGSRIPQPKEFTGENILDWLDAMEEWFEIENEPKNRWVQLATFRLAGDPLSAWRALKREHPNEYPTDWEGMRHYLLENYSNYSIGQAKEEMRRVQWRGDVNKLVAELQNIANKAPRFPRDEIIRQAYIKLPDDIALRLKNEDIISIPQLLKLVRTEQEGYRRYNERKQAIALNAEYVPRIPNPNKRMDMQRPRMQPQPIHNLSIKPSYRENPVHALALKPVERRENFWGANKIPIGRNPNYEAIKTLKCTNCKGWGHLREECPNTKTGNSKPGMMCYGCKGEGHSKSDCPTTTKLGN